VVDKEGWRRCCYTAEIGKTQRGDEGAMGRMEGKMGRKIRGRKISEEACRMRVFSMIGGVAAEAGWTQRWEGDFMREACVGL
jgi:hypothetical protein